MRLAFVALLVPSIGSAEPLPTIDSRFPPTIRVSAATDVAIERGEITWLVIGAEMARHSRPTTVAIDLPAGTRVVGMSFDTGEGPIWATQREPLAADHAIRTGTSPALAEWSGSSSGEEHVTLRITQFGHATFALELPAIPSVRVEAPVAMSIDGKHQPKTATFAPTAVASSGPRLGDRMSLLVDTTVPAVDLGVAQRESLWSESALDKQIIRRYVRRHLPAITHCFERVAQRTNTGSGAMLHFTIDDSGDTSDVSADVEDDDIRPCLESEVSTWEFPALIPHSTSTRVNYPIRFELL